VVTGVEMFRKLLDQGEAGDNVVACCRGTNREVERGRCCAARQRQAHTKFKAEAYILTKEEGRPPYAVLHHYRPILFPHDRRDRGGASAGGHEMVMPATTRHDDRIDRAIAMERSCASHSRGWRTVGSGVVTSIIE